MNRLIFVLLVLALRAEAAMVRVVFIESARTIAIERNGTRETAQLAGIEIISEAAAIEFLQRTLGGAWVLIESADGGVFVYRSPDALFINRELVLRGLARATMAGIVPKVETRMTVLGVSGASQPQTRSDTDRRSPDPPKPRPRPQRRRPRTSR